MDTISCCYLAIFVCIFTYVQAKSPHLFLILVDDLGYYNVGWNNPSQISPNINELAADGIRLEQHYTYQYCSPTRCSVLSGRLPIHVNELLPTPQQPGGMDLRMKTIADQLKKVNYTTAFVGKGHIGSYAKANLPIHRGFDHHFGFLGGGEDHMTQQDQGYTDLWRDNQPAFGENGTMYSCDLYTQEMMKLLNNHNPDEPFFGYLAFQNTHAPYQAPARWLDPKVNQSLRQLQQAMVTAVDSATGNITQLLKNKGMWNDTLLVWSSDNGGPQYWAANNHPLRGGKWSDFQGGVRTAAFVSGGLLPPSAAKTVLTEPIHVTDWYSTYAHLAGVDPSDASWAPGVPGLDSINMWPLLTGQTQTSPRQEIPLSTNTLIVGDWKILNTGFTNSWDAECVQHNDTDPNCNLGYWTGSDWPQANCGGGNPGEPTICPHDCTTDKGCEVDPNECSTSPCLFNLKSDPLEKNNLAAEQPDMLAKLHTRLSELQQTLFQTTDSGMTFTECDASWDQTLVRNGGFASYMCASTTLQLEESARGIQQD